MKRLLLVLVLALITLGAVASAQQPIVYRDQAEEQRFRALTAELRCVMCQNQSLADSNAPIAVDLRNEVLDLMREGNSDAQIKHYLVERYSEFVLYKPPVRPMTWLLWFGPGLLILGGGILIAMIVRKHARNAPASPPADDHQEW